MVNYIFHAVQQSGCCGFSDDEVYSMAVHAIDEPDLEIGKPMNCNVVVNHHIELTEEEKALVKLAYMLGRNHTFDAAPTVRKRNLQNKKCL